MTCPNATAATEAVKEIIAQHEPIACTMFPDQDHTRCQELRDVVEHLANECMTQHGCTDDYCTVEGGPS